MQIFGSIQTRAEKYLTANKNLFGSKWEKEGPLVYSRENAGLQAEFKLAFCLQRSFISRLFKLHITYTFTDDFKNLSIFQPIQWDYVKKGWKSKQNQTAYLAYLNQREDIKLLTRQIDFEKIQIEQCENKIKVTMIPIPGSFVFMLFPPMQYFIKLKKEEVKVIYKLAFLIQEITQQYQLNKKESNVVII